MIAVGFGTTSGTFELNDDNSLNMFKNEIASKLSISSDSILTGISGKISLKF